MDLTIEYIKPENWTGLAELAHQVCFGQTRPPSLNTHHFIVGVLANNELAGYFTCLEMDKETVYIQYGGVFPNYEKTIHVVPGYVKMLNFLKERYKQAWTRIENTNLPMLKLALQFGFIVTGTFSHSGKLYLELTNAFGGK